MKVMRNISTGKWMKTCWQRVEMQTVHNMSLNTSIDLFEAVDSG